MNKLDIINGNDIESIIDLFKKKEKKVTYDECEKQYDVTKHKIFDPVYRKDKIINKDVIINGVVQFNEDGSTRTTTEVIPVARIGEPFQGEIVEQRIGFMLSVPVEYNMSAKDEVGNKLIERTKYILDKNRMDFRNKEILRRQMSEMGCARLWYFVKEDEGADTKLTLKCKVLSPALGDTLIPLKDEYDRWIAFARGYKVKEDKNDIEHFDIYTADFEYHYANRENKWQLDTLFDPDGKEISNPVPNPVGKIMVGYYEQDFPEWYMVQSMIERHEVSVSNHADMNDYFGSPILAVSGEVQGFVAKGTQGQILELSENARANYLQLTTPPESILKEQDRLRELIFSLSNTADISFDKVKGIGNLSAIALQLLFISSTMAAKTKEENFAISLQRELNIIMTAIAKVIDTKLAKGLLSVTTNPKINVFTPKDDVEFTKMLGQAVQDGIMSVDQAVELNDLTIEKAEEIATLKSNQSVTNTDTKIVSTGNENNSTDAAK